MVRETYRNGEKLYTCGVCGFAYKEKVWAKKCEDFCTKHNACSLVITSHSVNTGPYEVEEK